MSMSNLLAKVAQNSLVPFITVAGSRLYHLDVESSDYDFRGIALQPLRKVLSVAGPKEQFEYQGPIDGFSEKVDVVLWDVAKFFKLLLQNNPNVLEVVASQHLQTTYSNLLIANITNRLQKDLPLFFNRNFFNTHGGMATAQMRDLEKTEEYLLPNRVALKAAAHGIRVLLTANRYLETAVYDPDVSQWKDQLLSVKNGNMDAADIWRWYREEDARFASFKATHPLQSFTGQSTALADDYIYEYRMLGD